MRLLLVPALLFLSLPELATAQSAKSRSLIDGDVANLIEALSLTLRNHYVYQEKVDALSSEMQSRSRGDSYQAVDDPEELASLLSADLVDISGDEHFSVNFDPEWIAQAKALDESGEALSLREDTLDALRQSNFGFKTLQILDGNIGYVRFDFFPDPERSFEAAANAMSFVEHTDAVIFDMRYNRGGHNLLGNFLASFLFDASEETLLLESRYMEDGERKSQSYWAMTPLPGPHRPDVPVYILTSSTTFSAAEWFTYSLKKLERATIVGQQTSGASHSVTRTPINDEFLLQVPTGLLSVPPGNSDFEGRGVVPHHDVPSQVALDYAHRLALKDLSARSNSSSAEYEWMLPVLDSRIEGHTSPDASRKESLTGNYSGREIRVESGRLIYYWRERFNLGLTAIGHDLFEIEGINDFRFRFIEENGKVTALEKLDRDGTRTTFPRR